MLVGLGLELGVSSQLAIAEASVDDPADTEQEVIPFLRPPATCPEDLATLTVGLIRDLPRYANLVARRSLGVTEDGVGFSTVLIAGKAELEPLEISPLTFSDELTATAADVQQLFFTTLERRYTDTEAINLEQYHWLFLTEGEDGWRLTLMFSRTAPDEGSSRPPTPPRENSDGIIGQAVRLWLRDCRAGAIYPIAPGDEDDTEL